MLSNSNPSKCQRFTFQCHYLNSFRVVALRPSHSCWDSSSSLSTFTVIAVKRTAASGMELRIGSIWRSLSLKGSRLCGGLAALPATAQPFSGLHSTRLLVFFFFRERNLLGNWSVWPSQLFPLTSQQFVALLGWCCFISQRASTPAGLVWVVFVASCGMSAHYLVAELFKRVAFCKRTSIPGRERHQQSR